MIRAALDHYPDRVAIGAVGVRTGERFARYVRPDELHLAVDTRLSAVRFDADELRATIEDTLAAVDAVGAAATWALSDHDVIRPASRYGGGAAGLARARAMALVQLALPGAVYLYNGDELGLPDVELPDEARRDAVWKHAERRPRRLPRAPAVGGRPARVRLHRRHAVAAGPRLLRRALRRRPARGHRLDPLALPPRPGAAAAAPRLHRRRASSGSARRPAASRSAAWAPRWSARSTPRRSRCRCPRATRCWPAARSTEGLLPPGHGRLAGLRRPGRPGPHRSWTALRTHSSGRQPVSRGSAVSRRRTTAP